MIKHSIDVRVRYAETDQMGFVYYGNYLQFLEIGRVEWLRNIGVSYKVMEENNIMLPVVNLNVDYKKPAFYDDLLTITTTLKEIPTRKITFEYTITNSKRDLIIKSESTLVFIEISTKRIIKCPTYILEKLS